MKRILIIVGVLLVLAGSALAGALWYVTPRVRELLAENLARQTGRSVQVDGLSWSLWSGIHLRGRRIEIGPLKGTNDSPLLQADSVDVQATLAGLLAETKRVETVRLRGLRLHFPPRREAETSEPAAAAPPAGAARLQIGELILEDASLEVASSEAVKPPRRFHIHELRMKSLQLDRELPFDAHLVYPRPEGELWLKGAFGPWNRSDPAASAIRGTYDFRDADLGQFKRIAGRLTAKGSFDGTIRETSIQGRTEIPDFSLTHAGQLVPLRTEFRALLKERGANLELVEARTEFFRSTLVSRGNIVKDGDGRRVELRVTAEQARIEDLLKFALKSPEPPLVGDVRIDTEVSIPSDRERTVLEKIRIQGDFEVRNGRFTSVNIEKTLERLSRIAGGESAGEQGESALTHMSGQFELEDGVIEFRKLVFGVPGFDLDLAGEYVIPGETMNLRGRLLLKRSPSEMLPESWSRWTSIMDPYFRGDRAGVSLPILITGSRTRPSIRITGAGR